MSIVSAVSTKIEVTEPEAVYDGANKNPPPVVYDATVRKPSSQASSSLASTSVTFQSEMSTAYTPSKSFHSGLFGCTNDLGTFCVSLLLPCLVYGQNKKMLNVESDCRTSGIKYGVCFVIQSCMGGKLRGEIRRERGLEGSALEDCMLHLACRPCALTQERIELDRMERFGHLDELVFQRKKVVD